MWGPHVCGEYGGDVRIMPPLMTTVLANYGVSDHVVTVDAVQGKRRDFLGREYYYWSGKPVKSQLPRRHSGCINNSSNNNWGMNLMRIEREQNVASTKSGINACGIYLFYYFIIFCQETGWFYILWHGTLFPISRPGDYHGMTRGAPSFVVQLLVLILSIYFVNISVTCTGVHQFSESFIPYPICDFLTHSGKLLCSK